MVRSAFKIQLLSIHWIDHSDNQYDLCAHGQLLITLGDEVLVEEREDVNNWWSITAAALHLLRTLELDHTPENPIADCLVPGEGHHIDHLENDPMVHIETAYPLVEGRNWWVRHQGETVELTTHSSTQNIVLFEQYKSEVLSFVDHVDLFYKQSNPKILPKDDYDRKGYLKLCDEWNTRRQKWRI